MKLSRGIKLEWSICFDMVNVMVVCHMHTFQRKSLKSIRALPTFEYMCLKYKRNCLHSVKRFLHAKIVFVIDFLLSFALIL